MEPFEFCQTNQLFWTSMWNKRDNNLLAGLTTKWGGVSQPPYESWNFGFHVDDDPNDVYKNRNILADKLEVH
ncbi:hypothetical protein J416_01219 [Gracilibacillus halophilus YIM-C55.5]|uniref:Uncharacterized protein n=1 Tax=Gracilibacillus halophilus YIM-C55.5 TaxID=1308866 RepID=N4WQA3_9BACI|nr:laccase domain-containing protein [Gracilibacillus halophilus]ENH98317.1 hypothetical protein J416_01219 [Gracilibacillus halophilus YIM-C55.5]